MLFRTVLEKALFSSPAACLQTLKERIRRLEARDATHPDLASLRELHTLVQQIEPAQFSKLQHLIAQLKDDPYWRWDGLAADDRLVLFTERIETLKFLQQHLPAALGLKADAVAILHGQLPDQDIQQTVEDFSRSHSPLRLLIASDVASEGLNLHYQSHRLIHFDIPWSLMVFQQRNGRVDRYGQTQAPKIGYLYTQPRNERVCGDLRYLEILIEKDEQAAKNIGDPSAFMGLYDEDAETLEVAKAIEGNTTAEAFAQQLAGGDIDPFELLWGDAANSTTPPVGEPAPSTATLPSLFAGHYHYARDGLRWLRQHQPEQQPAVQADDATRTLSFQPGRDLAQILERDLAPEMWPTDNTFALCADTQTDEGCNLELATLPPELATFLATLKGRITEAALRDAICRLCDWKPLTVDQLATFLGKSRQYLRNKHLIPMVRDGELRFRYPESAKHPHQAYVTAKAGKL